MANKKPKGYVVEITGDVSGLTKALGEVKKSTGDIQKELNQVNNLLKIDPTNVTLLSQKQELLSRNIDEYKKKLQALEGVQDQVTKQFTEKTLSPESYRQFQRELEATKQKLQSLSYEKNNVEKLGKAFDNVTENVAELKEEIYSINKSTIGETLYNDLAKVNSECNTLQSELKKVNDSLKLDPSNVVLTAQKEALLTNQIELTAKQLKSLENVQDEVNHKYLSGDIGADAFREFEREIENTRIKLKNLSGEKDGLKPIEDDLNDATKSAKSFKDGISEVSATTVAKGTLMADALKAVGEQLINIAENTREYRQDLSKLNTNAQQAGIGLGSTRQALKDLNAITGETDSNVEALSDLMKSGLSENQLLTAVQALSGAVIQFPDTLKIESLADSLQETLKSGKSTGQFDELLNRMGVNLDAWNKGLQNAAMSGEQYNYVMETLAKSGLSNVTKAYVEQNKVLVDSANAQFELNDAYAQIGQAAEPMITKFKTDFANTLLQNLPQIESLLGKTGDALVKVLDTAIEFKSVILGGAVALGTFKASLAIGNTVLVLVNAIKSFKTAQEAATAAQIAFNAAADVNPYVLLASAIAAVVSGIAIFAATTNKATGAVENYNQAMTNVEQSNKDRVISTQAEMTMLQKKVDIYDELRTKANRTAEEETQLKAVVQDLSSVLPNNTALLNAQKGVYDDLSASVENYINKQMASLNLDNLKNSAQEAMKYTSDLQKAVDDAQTNLDDWAKKNKGNATEIDEVFLGAGGGDTVINPFGRGNEVGNSYAAALSSAKKALSDNKKIIDDYSNALKNSYKDINETNENGIQSLYSDSNTSLFDAVGQAVTKSTDIAIKRIQENAKRVQDAYSKEKGDLDHALAMDWISTSEYYAQYGALTQKYNIDVNKYAEERYQYQKEQQKEALENQKKAIEEQKKAEEDRLNKRKEQLQKEKDALTSVNDENQRAIDIEKARQELENLRNNKTVKTYMEGVGNVYETDKKAIADAQKNISDLMLQQQTSYIDKLIKGLDNNDKNALKNADAFLSGNKTGITTNINKMISQYQDVSKQLSMLKVSNFTLPNVQNKTVPPTSIKIDFKYESGDININGNAKVDKSEILRLVKEQFDKEFKPRSEKFLNDVIEKALLAQANHR